MMVNDSAIKKAGLSYIFKLIKLNNYLSGPGNPEVKTQQ
jgi:hypothetical protein